MIKVELNDCDDLKTVTKDCFCVKAIEEGMFKPEDISKNREQSERLHLVLNILERAYEILQYSNNKHDIYIRDKIDDVSDEVWELVDLLR